MRRPAPRAGSCFFPSATSLPCLSSKAHPAAELEEAPVQHARPGRDAGDGNPPLSPVCVVETQDRAGVEYVVHVEVGLRPYPARSKDPAQSEIELIASILELGLRRDQGDEGGGGTHGARPAR